MVAHRPCFDLARPADDKRDTQAPLIEQALPTFENLTGSRIHVRTEEAMGIRFIFEVRIAAVIPADDNDRVIVDIQFFKQIHNLTNLPVDHMNHCRIALRLIGPDAVTRVPLFHFVFLPRRIVLRKAPRAVRRRPGTIAEEGFVFVVTNEFYGFFEDHAV